MATDGRYELLTKKEVIKLERERKHLQANLAGIKNMRRLPDALFIVDSNNELIAVKEARKLGIPVVAVVDTNCDPTEVDHVIPGNDDALRAIRLFTSKISDSVIEGVAASGDKAFHQEMGGVIPAVQAASAEGEEAPAEAEFVATPEEVAASTIGEEDADEVVDLEAALGGNIRKAPATATIPAIADGPEIAAESAQ
jgi:small subunit ribosomal protein S2